MCPFVLPAVPPSYGGGTKETKDDCGPRSMRWSSTKHLLMQSNHTLLAIITGRYLFARHEPAGEGQEIFTYSASCRNE